MDHNAAQRERTMRERWSEAEFHREVEELRHERLAIEAKLRRRERLAREERAPKSR